MAGWTYRVISFRSRKDVQDNRRAQDLTHNSAETNPFFPIEALFRLYQEDAGNNRGNTAIQASSALMRETRAQSALYFDDLA